MKFNEKSHAFIAAKFYVHLTEAFGERGKNAFIHATQYYASQRGRRMAQKAIRDGEDLCFETYQKYGEWVSTPEISSSDQAHIVETIQVSPDYIAHIHRCPWHIQFEEMGLIEAGHEYCNHLDNSICRGFNPYIIFEVPQTIHKSDYCIHKVVDARLKEASKSNKKMEYVKDFEYHCAHSYWAYSEVTGSIFESKGEEVNTKVLKDFAEAYGQEMADKITEYKHTNFNVINY